MSGGPVDRLALLAAWESGAGFEAEAAAIRPAAAALGGAERARVLDLVDGSLACLEDDVRTVQIGHAARRIALAEVGGESARAAAHLESYKRFFGPEHAERLATRSGVLRKRARGDDRDWMKEKKTVLREPLLSAEHLRAALGPRVEDHKPLAAISLALHTADSAIAVKVAERPGVEQPKSRLDLQIGRLLGPRCADVDRIASLLDQAGTRRSEDWIKARRLGFRRGLALPFLESTHALLVLENELDTARGSATRREEPDHASPVADLASKIEALRDGWVEEHGALAAVYLHAERQNRLREQEQGPERLPPDHTKVSPPLEPAPASDSGIDLV